MRGANFFSVDKVCAKDFIVSTKIQKSKDAAKTETTVKTESAGGLFVSHVLKRTISS